MQNNEIFFSILSAIILFLFGLSAFSHELQKAAGNKLKEIVDVITRNRFSAFFAGLVFTVLIQSSTAVTSLTVSLVNSGSLAFKGALAIILGAYVGTTATAWLVAFKVTGIGPIFIVMGALLGFFPSRMKVFGKGVFYFGFIFFSLDLISHSLTPIKENEAFINILSLAINPFWGILIGICMTVMVQSSAVITGLAIILVQHGMLSPEQSIPIVLGANLGTTLTPLLVSFSMNRNSQRVAISNTLITTIGIILILPFLPFFTAFVLKNSPNESAVVAIAHLTFNLILVSIFMTLLDPFVKFMDRYFPDTDHVSYIHQ